MFSSLRRPFVASTRTGTGDQGGQTLLADRTWYDRRGGPLRTRRDSLAFCPESLGPPQRPRWAFLSRVGGACRSSADASGGTLAAFLGSVLGSSRPRPWERMGSSQF
jgi:hypothetical protein